MSEIKENVHRMKPGKFYCSLAVVFIIFCIAAGVGGIAKFGGRLPMVKEKLKETVETNRQLYKDYEENYNNYAKDAIYGDEYSKINKNDLNGNYSNSQKSDKSDDSGEISKWHDIKKFEKSSKRDMLEGLDKIEIKDLLQLTTSDYVFLGGVMLVFWVILSIYWLYTTIYVINKARERGVNVWIFGILALFTNIFGVVCLWLYIRIHKVCPKCGRIQPLRANANNCTQCGTALYVKCPDCSYRVSGKDKYCGGCGRNMQENEEEVQ